MVREKGLEPSRTYVHMNLNHTRLPVPPSPHINFFSVIFHHYFIIGFCTFQDLALRIGYLNHTRLPIPPPLHIKESYFNIVICLCQQIKVDWCIWKLYYLVHYLFINSPKNQHLIQQVFNVSQNGRFFTDLLDFVEKNIYHQTTLMWKNIILNF